MCPRRVVLLGASGTRGQRLAGLQSRGQDARQVDRRLWPVAGEAWGEEGREEPTQGPLTSHLPVPGPCLGTGQGLPSQAIPNAQDVVARRKHF